MPLTLRLGSQNLASYVRVNPGDGLDPAASGYDEPRFADSPVSDGQALIRHSYGNREQSWPLKLKADSKQALHDLVRDLNREVARAEAGEVLLEWRDDAATDSSFYDVRAARFEADYSYRRQAALHLDGTLRAWTAPFAHTATARLVASLAGTGPQHLQAASPLLGDADAEPEWRLEVRHASAAERAHLVAQLPHPSYQAFPPISSYRLASALLGFFPGVAGDAMAPASQAVKLPHNYAPRRSNHWVEVDLLPEPYRGRRHVAYAYLRHAEHGRRVRAELSDQRGARGPEARFEADPGRYGFERVGVFHVPSGAPTVTLRLSFEQLDLPTGYTAYSKPHFGGMVIVPDDSHCLIGDQPSLVFLDRFTNRGMNATLAFDRETQMSDSLGYYSWTDSFTRGVVASTQHGLAVSPGPTGALFSIVLQPGIRPQIADVLALNYNLVVRTPLRTSADVLLPGNATPLPSYRTFKLEHAQTAGPQLRGAIELGSPNCYLALQQAAVASIGLHPSINLLTGVRFELGQRGPRAWAAVWPILDRGANATVAGIPHLTGSVLPLACVGASGATVADIQQAVIQLTAEEGSTAFTYEQRAVRFTDYRTEALTATRGASQLYLADLPNRRRVRGNASLAHADLEADSFGRTPALAPLDHGSYRLFACYQSRAYDAPDNTHPLAVEVRARERWHFER